MEKISSLRISNRSPHNITDCFDHAGASRWTNFQLSGPRIKSLIPYLADIDTILSQTYQLPLANIRQVRLALVKPPDQGPTTVCVFQLDNDFVNHVEPHLLRKITTHGINLILQY